MMIKKRLAIAVSAGLLLSAVAVGTAAAVSSGRYATPASTTMVFGSSGNILTLKGPRLVVGTVGSILPGGCALIGVGDYIPSTPCPVLLAGPYQLTETPLAVSTGVFTYFTVTTTNAAPAAQPPADRIVFSIRLCESGANGCAAGPPGGITKAACSPVPGSKTCSWLGKLPFQQWKPATPYACVGGICHGGDPGFHDEGLIDVVASRGCNSSANGCPNGTYDPGHVSWSVAYIR